MRRLRIDRKVKLKTMAEELGVSSAFLSAVETGAKSIPLKLIDSIIEIYQLNKQQKDELIRAAGDSKSAYKIDVTPDSRELVAAFARKIESGTLDTKQTSALLKLLKN